MQAWQLLLQEALIDTGSDGMAKDACARLAGLPGACPGACAWAADPCRPLLTDASVPVTV